MRLRGKLLTSLLVPLLLVGLIGLASLLCIYHHIESTISRDNFKIQTALEMEINSKEVMREIRKIDQYKKMLIIALTAKVMVGDRGGCINAGAADYITKPVDEEQLISMLKVWLYKS